MAVVVPSSTSYTPSQSSMSSIISEAASFLQLGTLDAELDSVAKTAVNAGIAKINRHTWKKVWNQTVITTVASDADYSLPTDFKEPITLLRLDSDSNRDGRIAFVPHQSFMNELEIVSGDGSPDAYTIDYNQRVLLLSSPPNAAFVSRYPTLRLVYHRRVAKLTQDSSTTGLPPEFDDWLVLFTAERLAVMRDPEKRNYIKSEQMESWRDLRRDDNEIQTDWSVW